MESGALNGPRRPAAAGTPAPRAFSRPKPKRRLNHEKRILLLALGSGAAGVVLSIVLLWTGDHASDTRWTLTFLVMMIWLGFAFGLRAAGIRPLHTLSNLHSGLREGDFSFRVP